MARVSSKRRELFASELPAHRVTVRAFSIDRTEVTNAAFKSFVDAHPSWSRERLAADGHNGEYLKTWTGGSYPVGDDDVPVTFITWHAASAFCEIEWETVADRGGVGVRSGPWRSRRNSRGVMICRMPRRPTGRAQTSASRRASVHSHRARPLDMAGNVWEFVADQWTDSYVAGAKTSPGRRVIRGGSFGGSPVNLRVRYRDSHPESGAGPHVGFRCAR